MSTTRKKPKPKKAEAAAPSEPHPWADAGFVPVTVKFTPDLHRRAKVWTAGYRGRLLSAFVTLAVEYMLDECDAGRQPPRFVEAMRRAEAAAAGKKTAPKAGAAT